jgi:opacity protein-like surface antigen
MLTKILILIKKIMKKLFITTTIIGSLLSSIALAENKHSLGLEFSEISVEQEYGDATYLGSDKKILPTIRYGYKFQFDKFFVKPSASYAIGSIEIKDTDDNNTNDKSTISQLITIEGDLGYDINNKLSVFGTLGLASSKYERDQSGNTDSATNTGVLFGFGVEYDISDSFSINTKYQNTTIVTPVTNSSDDYKNDIDMIKVGASYNF